jgi:hypothetical protein
MTAVTLSVSQLAKRWQIRREHVKQQITSGVLTAFDLTPAGPRRTYRVTLANVAKFEASLAVRPTKKPSRRSPSKTPVKEFF